MKELNKLERLDLAARAMVAEKVFPSQQALMAFLTSIITFLAFFSTAPRAETLAIRLLAATCVVVTLSLLLRWRYALHAMTCVFIGAGIGRFLFNPEPHTVMGWIAQLAYSFGSVGIAYRLWQMGGPYAAVQAEGWDAERLQVKACLDALTTEGRPVLYIPSGSFWTGYFTYQLIYVDDSWAVTKFKTGNDRLLDFRILEKNAVRMTETEGGKLDFFLNNKKIRNVSTPDEVRASLARLGVSAMAIQ